MRLLFFLLISFPLCAEMFHHDLNQDVVVSDSYILECEAAVPFDELLISWNGQRPEKGHIAFYVSLFRDGWSPWLLYGEWGDHFQRGSSQEERAFGINVDQDTMQISDGSQKFRVLVVGKNGANLNGMKSLHIYASPPESLPCNVEYAKSYLLDVPGLSQIALPDSRRNRLCSPTSTTAVIRFLTGDMTLNPLEFAEKCWDETFDIFGNWVLNVAEANNRLQGSGYFCWVEKVGSFNKILDKLSQGLPSVISVRGPLPGSASSYTHGHLLVIMGYDHKRAEVICMDPAFSADDQTIVRYSLDDLLKAWGRRNNVAYLFAHLENQLPNGILPCKKVRYIVQ